MKIRVVRNGIIQSSGFVFVHQTGFVKVVDSSNVEGEGIRFSLTKAGNQVFGEKLESDYQYWFDIITPRNEDEVLAQYSLPIGKKALSDLKELGIPAEFPAVIQHRKADYTSYYFAGDYADEEEVPQIYQTSGFSSWKKYVTDRKSFYWNTYVPMMKELLQTGLHQPMERQVVEVEKNEGFMVNSRNSEKYLQVLKGGKWEDLLIKGVNMGIAKPGSFPGETAITKEEYIRWFNYIGKMNANAIRIYTIHPPAFYEAFYEYNQSAEQPLYLFHGVWMNEESMVAEKNVYDQNQTEEFKKEISRIVDLVHGNATLPEQPGHASGTYSYDISEYMIGYMLGVEWDPEVVVGTNEKNKHVKSYNGTYFRTADASPFESWLASMMDFTATYEASKYNWQHSISFTNWVTTDLLHHPAEPSETEDMVSVNPNHIVKKDAFHAGMFASYHIYPYYPDFLNYEEAYLNYKDDQGKNNNYEAYLKELRAVHDMPVLVAEFGVPSSRGLTHVNPFGMNQGKHSEQEQGEIDTRLFQSIVKEQYAGGLVFTWQDEWFKRTWNTMDFDNPDRRPYWNNMQTNEQHFGLLSFDPGVMPFYPDGLTGDWEQNRVKSFYETDDSHSLLKKMFVASDEGYLYIRLDYSKAINLEKNPTYLLFDTISRQGQTAFQLDGMDNDKLLN